MSTTACVQPGCTGSILDGYCDVCGSPGPASSASAASAGPAASSPSASIGGVSGRCAQPGCTGTVVDGYCDVCGSPGPAGSPGSTGSTGAAGSLSVATMPAGLAQSPSTVSRAPQPDRVHRPGVGPHRRQQGHPSGRHVVDPTAGGPARGRPDLHPPGPGGRRGRGGAREPDGARGPAHLPVVRVTRGPLPRRPARAHRGVLPDLPQPVLVHPQAQGRRRGRRPVRRRGCDRPRRAGLDLRRPRPQRLRPLGRAQGSAELRRPGRPRRGHRRAAVPRPGRAPAHRRDLQLRLARRCRGRWSDDG